MHAAESISDLVLQRKEFLRFLQRRVASPAVAEDILQSAYARAVEQSSSLRLQESAQAWFYRILRNAAVRIHRARRALKKQLLLICSLCARHGCVNCTCTKTQSSN